MTWREEERKKSSVNWWWEEERKIERENWCGGKKGGSWQTERRIFKWLHNNDCGGFSLGVWESKLVSFRGKQFLKHADFFLQYEANTLCTGHWHWIHYLDLVLYVLLVHCGIATGISFLKNAFMVMWQTIQPIVLWRRSVRDEQLPWQF